MSWANRRPRRTRRKRGADDTSLVVFRWDLDKTYLKVEFDRVRDLVRIPFERGTDKIAAPGVATLIKSLREVAKADGREARVYFLTASPPQISRGIKEKLSLDGIEYDGIAFKNQLQHLMRGKFRNLREQVGYKLVELLKGRAEVPAEAREFLFGDDWESDPLVYSLYADILAGRVDESAVQDVLEAIHVDPAIIAEIRALLPTVEHRDAVARIYINLERRTPPANFRWFGPRLVPTFNYFQTAICLYGDGVLDAESVATVARSLIERSGYTGARLANSLADVIRRAHITRAVAAPLRAHLRAEGLVPMVTRERRPRTAGFWERLLSWLRRGDGDTAPAAAEAIDYRALVAEWRPAR